MIFLKIIIYFILDTCWAAKQVASVHRPLAKRSRNCLTGYCWTALSVCLCVNTFSQRHNPVLRCPPNAALVGTKNPDRNAKPLSQLSCGYVEWAITDPVLGFCVVSKNSANVLSEGTDGGAVALCAAVLHELYGPYIALNKENAREASFCCLILVTRLQ